MKTLRDVQSYLAESTKGRVRPSAVWVPKEVVKMIVDAYKEEDKILVKKAYEKTLVELLFGKLMEDWVLFQGVVFHSKFAV